MEEPFGTDLMLVSLQSTRLKVSLNLPSRDLAQCMFSLPHGIM